MKNVVVWITMSLAADIATSGSVEKEIRGPYLSVRDHSKDTSISKKPTIKVELNPSEQNIPLNPILSKLRPPQPRIPDTYDIFVGISSFRDGWRCGKTLLTGFSRADAPTKVYFGIVDQLLAGDISCLESYCTMAAEFWPNDTSCRYKNQIEIDRRSADESRGPTLARHYQQKLVGSQEFCLQIDAHSMFTKHWDTEIVKDWNATNNEMAILSTYIHNIAKNIEEDGTNKYPRHATHLCQTKRGGYDNVRNVGADLLYNSKQPQLQALWGAGFSFGKCHSERRVPVDSRTLWMFDGEEFQRSSHLWTFGYDLYSPSVNGMMIYHNYTAVPAKFYHLSAATSAERTIEQARANNRVKYLLGIPFQGEMDGEELEKYQYGNVRTLQQYLDFAGITFTPNQPDNQSCYQLHWIPYSNPHPIENLLPGWRQTPPTKLVSVVQETQALAVKDPVFRQQIDKTVDEIPTIASSLELVGVVCLMLVFVFSLVRRSRSDSVEKEK